ncbi:MAG TPA: thrombospondin type 3 repeat-containing protein [Polyangiaceae bacterium]|nr:thrombospondin type 3 repeat-containing protein [Polyangiaceae bacterium]
MRWFLLAFLWCTAASASEVFKEVVARDWGLDEQPECVLCHKTNDGGARTATRPFAVTPSRYDVQGGNPGSLSAALRQVRSDQTDSDADGYSDYDEVTTGLNPNDASDGPEEGPIGPPPYSGPLPQHGCSAASPAAPSSAASALLIALGLSWLGHRRARSRAKS